MKNILKEKLKKGKACKHRPKLPKMEPRVSFTMCYNDSRIRDLLGASHNWDEITKEEQDAIWEKFNEIIEYIKHARNLKSILNRFSFRDKGKRERIVHYSDKFGDSEIINDNVYVLDLYRQERISKYGGSYIVRFAFQFIASQVVNGKCKIVMLSTYGELDMDYDSLNFRY